MDLKQASVVKFYLFFILYFIGFAGLLGTDWLAGTLRDGYTPVTVAWYLLTFAAFIGLLLWVEKNDISKRWLWGGAVLWRVMLLFTTPTLSDDVYRMLWDGYVANQGVSPYAYAIDSPALDYLEVPVRGLANNAWMASPYLPAAQAVFYGVTAVSPLHPFFLQAVMVLFDLGSAWIISKLLLLAILPARRLILYLWNPLVIIEVAHGAHVDAWMVFLALLAVYFAFKQQKGEGDWSWKNALSPFFLALGTLTKLLPGLLLPVLFWLWRWPQRIFYGLAALLILIPFGQGAGWGLGRELDGTGLFGALRIYVDQWNFNSGLFHWLEVGLGKLGVSDPVVVARSIVFVLLLAVGTVVFFVARHQRQPRSLLRLMSVPLMAYVLLTPTFHPWYLLILIAFLPFLPPGPDEKPWRWWLAAPWLYLSGALIFSYLTYLDPLDFGELEWVRNLEWIPVIGLLLVGGVICFKAKEGDSKQ